MCRYTVDCRRQLAGINGRFTVTGAKCLPQQRSEMQKELETVELGGVDTQPFVHYGLVFSLDLDSSCPPTLGCLGGRMVVGVDVQPKPVGALKPA